MQAPPAPRVAAHIVHVVVEQHGLSVNHRLPGGLIVGQRDNVQQGCLRRQATKTAGGEGAMRSGGGACQGVSAIASQKTLF